MTRRSSSGTAGGVLQHLGCSEGGEGSKRMGSHRGALAGGLRRKLTRKCPACLLLRDAIQPSCGACRGCSSSRLLLQHDCKLLLRFPHAVLPLRVHCRDWASRCSK